MKGVLMKKFLTIPLLGLILTGCAPMAYEAESYPSYSTGYNNYSNVYYYDNDYDYYDGLYGNYVGGVYYVYRSNGSRYQAPPPRYHRPPRFSQRGWDGFRPGDRFQPPHRPPFYDSNHSGYNRPDIRPSNPNRPPMRPDRPEINKPNNPDKPDLRPDSKPWDKRPEAKPVPPIMHDSRPTPNNITRDRYEREQESPFRR